MLVQIPTLGWDAKSAAVSMDECSELDSLLWSHSVSAILLAFRIFAGFEQMGFWDPIGKDQGTKYLLVFVPEQLVIF